MQHLDEGTIHAWLDGALPTTEAREVEHHLTECADCSAMVAEARGLVAGASRIVSSLDVVRGNVIPKTPAARGGRSVWHSLHLTPARAALAATLMIAVSTLLTVRHNTPDKLVLSSPATSNESPARAAQPRTAAPAPPPSVETPSSPRMQQAAVSSEAKDRTPLANEPRRDLKNAIKADIADRTEVADARAKLPVDSPSRVADKPASPPSAPLPPASAIIVSGAGVMDTSQKKILMKAEPAADSTRMANEMRSRDAIAYSRAAQRAPSLPACFEFVTGPVPTANLPRRFALQGSIGDTAQHVVRAVNENGRLDSVIVGSNWTRVSPNEITVRFASNQQTLTLPVRDTGLGATSGVAARREFAGQSVPSVTHFACRP